MKDGGEGRTKEGPRKPAEPTPKQAADNAKTRVQYC